MYKSSTFIAILAATTILSACASTGLKKNTWRSEAITTKDIKSVARVEQGVIDRIGIYADGDKMPFEGMQKADAGIDDGHYVRTRNSVQSYLKGISEIKCGDFKTFSLAEQANLNLGLTSAATILGGVGALLSPESTTQALSGSATMITGIQSSMNQNYYREKTFEIITKAIDVRRKTIWANIEAKRTRHATSEDGYRYDINEAIADMINYNNACSVIVGFEELANSVKDKEKQVDEATAKQKLGSQSGSFTALFDGPKDQQQNALKFLSIEEILATQ